MVCYEKIRTSLWWTGDLLDVKRAQICLYFAPQSACKQNQMQTKKSSQQHTAWEDDEYGHLCLLLILEKQSSIATTAKSKPSADRQKYFLWLGCGGPGRIRTGDLLHVKQMS